MKFVKVVQDVSW